MKNLLLLVLCLSMSSLLGQNVMFVHTATTSNSTGNVTYLDHPDLNGNPNARIAITHNYNPPGSTGVYNTNVSGAWYDGANWTIFNENQSPMVEGSAYNVFIMNNSESIVHIDDVGNQGTQPGYSIVDHPTLNGNPDANAVATNYWNPNSVYNDFHYGFWYDGANWNLYTENFEDIPLGSAFFIVANPSNAVSIRHVATTGNISNNWTVIDHPLLNGNPDGMLVVMHNWGPSGSSNNVIMDHPLGVWYTGSNWAIFTEDQEAMPENAAFDILVYDPALSTPDLESLEVGMIPNPANHSTTIQANEQIMNIRVFDLLGRMILSIPVNDTQYDLDVSGLTSGTYLVQLQSERSTTSKKLIVK